MSPDDYRQLAAATHRSARNIRDLYLGRGRPRPSTHAHVTAEAIRLGFAPPPPLEKRGAPAGKALSHAPDSRA